MTPTATIDTTAPTDRAAHRRPLRAAAVASLGLAAALGLSACSGSGVPPLEEVWPEAHASIQEASSVSVDGSVAMGGQEMTVAIAGQIDDSSYAGNVTMGEVALEVIGDTEYTYMKPNTAFYEENGGTELQELVGDKWLQMPAEQGGFTMSSMWSAFMDDIPTAEDFGDTEYTSEKVELNGEEVHKYTGQDEENGNPVSVYLSQDNKLVRVETGVASGDEASASPSASASGEGSEDVDSGVIDFSQWDAVEPVEMPAEAEVFAVPGM